MSVREMTLGKLIMGTSGLVEGLPSREAVIELDRRERELLDRVAKLEAAQEVTTGDVTVKSFNDLMKLAGEPRDIPVLREALRKPSRADYMFKETGSRVAQEKPAPSPQARASGRGSGS